MITLSILIQILIFVFSLSLYVALVSKILPLFLLKAKYKVQSMGDRGLKKYVFEGGRAIAYKPSGETEKYIKQYILLARDDDKYIKCKFDKRVFSAKYDVIAMDSNDKEIETVQISDPIVSPDDAREAILPENTAYVCIIVKEINGLAVPNNPKMHYVLWRSITFAGLTVVLTVAEYLILRASVMSVLAEIEPLLPNLNPVSQGLPLTQMLVSALLGFALAGITLFLHRKKDVKIF